MNKKELTKLVSVLEKQFKDLKYAVEQDEKKYRINFEDLCKKCELLKKYVSNDFELTKKYIQAMSFLNWFDFNKLYSDNLRYEVMNKKYSELTKYMKYNDYNRYQLKFTQDEENKSNVMCLSADMSDSEFTTTKDLFISTKCSNDIKNIWVDGHKIELERETDIEPERIKWEETIDYVVCRPFEFNENTIIAVYNYLKDTIKKDKEIKKYKNGGKN